MIANIPDGLQDDGDDPDAIKPNDGPLCYFNNNQLNEDEIEQFELFFKGLNSEVISYF